MIPLGNLAKTILNEREDNIDFLSEIKKTGLCSSWVEKPEEMNSKERANYINEYE